MYDREYYYGGHGNDWTGIVDAPVGKSTTLGLKACLYVGQTHFTPDQVEDIIDEFGEIWIGCEYEPFSHNCNNFSRVLIKHLVTPEGDFTFPNYVN